MAKVSLDGVSRETLMVQQTAFELWSNQLGVANEGKMGQLAQVYAWIAAALGREVAQRETSSPDGR